MRGRNVNIAIGDASDQFPPSYTIQLPKVKGFVVKQNQFDLWPTSPVNRPQSRVYCTHERNHSNACLHLHAIQGPVRLRRRGLR